MTQLAWRARNARDKDAAAPKNVQTAETVNHQVEQLCDWSSERNQEAMQARTATRTTAMSQADSSSFLALTAESESLRQENARYVSAGDVAPSTRTPPRVPDLV